MMHDMQCLEAVLFIHGYIFYQKLIMDFLMGMKFLMVLFIHGYMFYQL